MANSPGVFTQEKDLTFNIQAITSNSAGYVGMFRWGPVDEIVEITTNESELVQRFGAPDARTTTYFHAAANYLLYSAPLSVVRVVGTGARNSKNVSAVPATQLVKNDNDFETSNLTGISFIGRYPGDIGNSIKVSLANEAGFATWEYNDEFSYSPVGEQINMVVVDETGLITGSAGSVLERYELMTLVEGDTRTDGSSAYLFEVLKNQSQYVLLADIDEIDFAIIGSVGVYTQTMSGGVDDNIAANADFMSAWDLFLSEEAECIRLFTSFNPSTAVIRAIDNADTRLDTIVFNACRIDDVYNTADRVDNLVDYFGTVINKPSSYAFNVDNWKLVYDKYNDKNIWIPCDSDAAGLHARVFVQNEPWYSMAGFSRGQLKNVIKLAWISNLNQRETLYKNGINSIVAFKGEGTVLYGDKTALMAPSAFSRINVRTLFIVIKKAISRAARYQLFEFNDYITQTLFRNATSRYLEDVQSRRGLTRFLVVCDSTVNTPQVVSNNEFIGNIYITPNYVINFIKLNFIAVNGAVEFTEIEGA